MAEPPDPRAEYPGKLGVELVAGPRTRRHLAMPQPGDHESGRWQAAAQIRRDALGTHRAQDSDPAGRTVSAPRLAEDYLLPEVIRLLETAEREITAHDNDRGLCANCGSAFPCARAKLAAFTPGGIP